MSSTTTSHDSESNSIYRFFDALAERPKVFFGILIVLVALAGAFALIRNQKIAHEQVASSALFEAQKSIEKETKVISDSIAPAKAPEKGAKDAQAQQQAADVSFMKLDVDARYPESLKKLKAVEIQFSGTRAAFEAQMAQGNLYFQHGDAAKAAPLFEKAASSAPKSADRAAAYSALGYAHENSGKPADAVQAYEKALSAADASMKADILLAMARNYELMKDTAKARSTYDQILTQLPNTDAAKTAETLKARLQ